MPRLRSVHRRWGHRPQHGNQLARGPQGDLMRHSIRCALAAGGTYQTGGLPEISTNLAIVGRGATLEYTFSAAESPIMSVPGGVTVHISNLNFINGYSLCAYASALATQGNVTIDGGTFTGNTSEDGGSAIDNSGQLTVRGAAFTDNGG